MFWSVGALRKTTTNREADIDFWCNYHSIGTQSERDGCYIALYVWTYVSSGNSPCSNKYSHRMITYIFGYLLGPLIIHSNHYSSCTTNFQSVTCPSASSSRHTHKMEWRRQENRNKQRRNGKGKFTTNLFLWMSPSEPHNPLASPKSTLFFNVTALENKYTKS